MASLTYTNIETRTMNSLRIPTSNATEQTKVANLINEVYRDVFARADWYWLLKRAVINTVAKYTTGTATVTLASTTVTLGTAPGAGLGSFAGYVFLVPTNTNDSGAVFRISSHTAASATVTLDALYTGADSSTAAFKIYQDTYSLATDVGKVYSVKRYGQFDRLEPIGMDEMGLLKQAETGEGKPQVWSVFDFATTGDQTTARRLVVHPYPDVAYRLEYHYKQTLNTELSGSTRPLIPDDYVQILVYGALARGFPIFLNDVQRGAYYQALFNDLLAQMMNIQRERTGDQAQLTPRDDYRRFYRRGARVAGIHTSLGSWFDRLPNVP